MPSIETIFAAVGWGTAVWLYRELIKTHAVIESAEQAVVRANETVKHAKETFHLPAVIALPDLTEKD